jgi:hypothetical protein
MAYAVAHTDGFQSAVTWWQQVNGEEEQKAVLAALGEMSNRRGPGLPMSDRLAMIQAGIEIGMRDESVEMQLAGQFATEDPVAGAEFFTQFPSSVDASRYNSLTALLANWGKTDPTAAGAWAMEQKSQPWYDSAAAGFAAGIYDSDIVSAGEWLNTIGNEQLRDQISQRLTKKKIAGPTSR